MMEWMRRRLAMSLSTTESMRQAMVALASGSDIAAITSVSEEQVPGRFLSHEGGDLLTGISAFKK